MNHYLWCTCWWHWWGRGKLSPSGKFEMPVRCTGGLPLLGMFEIVDARRPPALPQYMEVDELPQEE